MNRQALCILLGLAWGMAALAAPIVWDFTREEGLAGGNFPLTLLGASRLGEDGLEIAEPEKNKAQGAVTGKTVHPELSPRAFRLTVEFKLAEKAFTRTNRVLVVYDNKHAFYMVDSPKKTGHDGIMVVLERSKGTRSFAIKLHAGYGQTTKLYATKPYPLEPNTPHTLSVDYNGAGTLCLEMDGDQTLIETNDPRPFSPAIFPLAIGDRGTSKYSPFEGSIHRVVLEAREPLKAKLLPKGRYSFVRDEERATAKLRLWVLEPEKYAGSRVEISGAEGITEGSFPFAVEEGGHEIVLTIPVNCSLKCAAYPCTLKVVGNAEPLEFPFELHICPKWYDNDQERGLSTTDLHYPEVRQSGCTHLGVTVGYGDFSYGQSASEGSIQNAFRRMDQYLRDGMHASAWCLGPGTFKKYSEQYPITRKGGEKNTKALEASNPEVQAKILDDVERYARACGTHPACDLIATSNESRDASFPNFSEHARESYRCATGKEIPPEVGDSRTGPHYRTLAKFPFTRIVPSNDPILEYYRWFWQEGDGWNPFLGKVAEAFAKGIGRPIATMYQPAVRVPPISGSGGPVTYNRHWTYIYPEPYNINYVISEQQNMVASTKGQEGVIASLQCFSYRSQLAPQEVKVDNPPTWAVERPNAVFITTPPDLLQEAMWVCFARQLFGIDAKSYKTLYDNVLRGESKLKAGYQFTNAASAPMLQKQFQTAGVPLGPLFRRIPERAPEVAVLESFSATIFAGRGTWGWQGKIYDYGTMATLANLNPKVLYEENIAKGVPAETKVIIMPDCDVLTEESYAALREFDRRGGLIVGDENLVPGLMADFRLPVFNRKRKDAMADDTAIRQGAQALRRDLADYYRPYSDTDKDNLFTLVRSWRQADYLFVINDRRQAGDYIGAYNRVLEQGMPNEGHAIIRRQAGAVYDLVAHKSVPFTSTNGETVIPVSYSTNDGKALLVTDAPLKPLALGLVEQAKLDARFELTVTSPDKDVLIPIQLTIESEKGYRADESGYAIVEDGSFTRSIHIPVNADHGSWSFTVTNLADGQTVTKTISIR